MSYRSVGTGVNGTGTSAAPGVPPNMLVNDIVVIGLYVEGAAETITIPTGFTQKVAEVTTAASRGRLYLFWKRITVNGDVTDEPDGDYDLSWTTSAVFEAVAIAFSGRILIGDPFDATVSGSSGSNSATTVALTLTQLVDGDVICLSTNHATNAGDFTAPSGMTERFDATAGGSGHHLAAYTQDSLANGSNAKTATSTGITGNSVPKIIIGSLQPDRVVVRATASTAASAGSTPLAVTLATHETGDLLLAAALGKYDTASQPTVSSGWVIVGYHTGGTGAQGTNTGPVCVAIAAKIATSSSETGPTFTAGATAPNNWHGQAISVAFPYGKVHADSLVSNAGWIASGADTDASSSTFTATTTALSPQPTTLDALVGFFVGPSSAGASFTSGPTITATGMVGGITPAGIYAESNVGFNSMVGVWSKQGFTGPLTSGVTGTCAILGWSTASGLVVAIAVRQMTPTSAGWGISLN